MLSTLWHLSDQSLTLTPKLGGLSVVIRYGVGLPMLAAGTWLLGNAVVQLASQISGKGSIGLVGIGVSLLFFAFLGPIGWWLVFAKTELEVEAHRGMIVERTEWKIGKRVQLYPISDYERIVISVEPLHGKNTGGQSRTMGLRVALQPVGAEDEPAKSLAWFEADKSEANKAREVARIASRLTKLPVQDDLAKWFEEAP